MQREKNGNLNLMDWDELKVIMREICVTKRFKQEQLTRLYNLRQGDRSMEEYYEEFQNLILHLDIVEPSNHCIAWLKGHFDYKVVSQLVVHKFDQIEDLVKVAIKVERNNYAKRTFGWNKNNDSYKSFEKKPTDRENQRYPPWVEGNPSSTPNTKGIIYFKCQGWGYNTSEFPNQRIIVLVEGDPYFVGG